MVRTLLGQRLADLADECPPPADLETTYGSLAFWTIVLCKNVDALSITFCRRSCAVNSDDGVAFDTNL